MILIPVADGLAAGETLTEALERALDEIDRRVAALRREERYLRRQLEEQARA